jgi:hypothetical protein
MKRFVTRALIVVAAILGVVFAQVAPASADAPADPSNKLASNLAALWTGVLETPASQNPAVGGGPECWDLGHRTTAQFSFVNEKKCTVKPGTKIFVVGWSGECSTFDDDCGRETDPNGCKATTAPALLLCAQNMDAPHAVPKITVDGKSVTVTEVNVPQLNIDLPEDNVFDALGIPTPGGSGLSAAHGWVALLNPLTPGSHEILITDPTDTEHPVTTTIVVTPGL